MIKGEIKMKKRLLVMLLAFCMILTMTACGGGGEDASSEGSNGDNILRTAASFAYPSLDVHKEYYGWYTSIYGLSEALFRFDENAVAVDCLAEDAVADGTTWTITLKDGVAFSNGSPLTPDMVIRNIQRLAEVNERFSYFADFDWKTDGDNKIIVDTGADVYPMLKNDLASPECGMVDLDATEDFDKNPICTGPFVIKEFIPEGDVTVARNDNYWGGDVNLDGAVFYYMQEDDPKLLAMQSGEIDCYNSVSSAALEVYEKDPDKYVVESVAGTRLQYYILNENRLDDSVREAINLTINKEAIADYLKGTVSPANSPYPDSTAYSDVTIPAVDTDKAKKLLEDDGYTLGDDGIYQKDGKPIKLNICYYAARSLDTLAVLMQEQLKAVGIDSYLTVEEDPDSTYIATADFDIALYCMISDKCGDPQYFIDSTLADGSYYNVAGFESAECEELIKQLKVEVDPDKRADLANQIVQIAIDDNAFGYVGLFNHTTVMKPGVSGFAEKIPFDFYGIDANTVK